MLVNIWRVKRHARERNRMKEMAEKFVPQKNMANTCETPRSRRRNRPTFLDLSNITRKCLVLLVIYVGPCLSTYFSYFASRSKKFRDLGDNSESWFLSKWFIHYDFFLLLRGRFKYFRSSLIAWKITYTWNINVNLSYLRWI